MPKSEALTVVIVVQNLPVPPDGRVWRHATSLVRMGFKISVICPMGKGFTKPLEIIDGVTIYRHPGTSESHGFLSYVREYSHSLFHEFRLLKRIISRERVHLIHICNPPDLLFLLARYCRFKTGAVVIFDHHDLSPEMYLAKFQQASPILLRCLKKAESWTFKSADVVITTSESMRQVALTRGQRSSADVFLVRSSPLANEDSPDQNDQAILQVSGEYLIGYVGVLGEQDGVDNLLRSVNLIVHKYCFQNIRVLIIGDGPAREALVALAAELRIQKYVAFLGWQQRKQFRSILSGCHLCVSPDSRTQYTDACAMVKIFEYMALCKPIAAFDLNESHRIAGRAATYAPSGDIDQYARDILDLLNDEPRRHRMGVLGRESFLNNWAWELQREQLRQAYCAAFARSTVACRDSETANLLRIMMTQGTPESQRISKVK